MRFRFLFIQGWGIHWRITMKSLRKVLHRIWDPLNCASTIWEVADRTLGLIGQADDTGQAMLWIFGSVVEIYKHFISWSSWESIEGWNSGPGLKLRPKPKTTGRLKPKAQTHIVHSDQCHFCDLLMSDQILWLVGILLLEDSENL